MTGSQKVIKYIATALAIIVMILVAVAAVKVIVHFSKKDEPTTAPVSDTTLAPAGESTTAAQGGEQTTANPGGEQTTVPGTSEDGTVTAVPGQDIPRNLDISMSAGNLTFVVGDTFGVKHDDSVIRVSRSGDTLSIENAHRHPTASERRRMDVTVTVPEAYAFGSVDIEFGAGKLIVHSLNAETLDFELGAGSATFDNLYVSSSAEIQEGAGELAIKSGTIANLTLQCGAGATRVNAALVGASRIDAAVGAVDLNFEGTEEDYCVTFSIGLGACYYNNEKVARNGSFGDGPNTVDITGGFGVMRVDVG